MVTIEERARNYACHVSLDDLNKEGLDADSFCGILHGYIKGATEQREIDLCVIAKWFKKNWRNYIDTDADGMIRFAGWEKDLKEAIERN